MAKIKWIIAALMILSTVLFSYPAETKIINGYKVIKGERPSIDLSKVSSDAYYPGKIWIKLAPEMEKSISDNQVFTKTKDGVLMKTGVEAIDRLNAKYAAEQFKPKLYGFYDISPASKQHREKHKAWGFHLWMEISLPMNANVIQAVKEYMALPEVEFAEPVYKDAIFEPVHAEPYEMPEKSDPKWTPNDTRYNEQWHYHNTGQQSGTVDCDIDLPEAWDIEKGKSNILVAIQDQGLQLNHPDLQAHIWSGIGYDFQANDSSIEPGDHGCHVGGTVSGVNNNGTGISGVAGGSGSGDGVRLMSVQVYTSGGTGGGNTNLPYIYSADNGAAISQNSWGYTTVGNYTQSVLDGIDYFNANGGGSVMTGGLVIFAAGNSNSSGLWYPGCYSGTLAVAATNNKDIRASYSNYDTWVDVSAPGGETSSVTARGVLSCWSASNYGFYQGTSMACPHTSGVAALILSLAPGMFSRTQVWSIIKNTTDPIDTINPTYAGKLGTGRVNAYKALVETQSLMAPPPTPSLVSPANASVSTSAKPAFDWSDATGASTYTIQVDNNSNFGSPEINETVASSQFTPLTGLAEGTYYWRVRANNTVGSSSFTSAWTVSVQLPNLSLSASAVNTTAAPGGTDTDSFNINNTGNGNLDYSMTHSYTGNQIEGGTWHSNNFQSGLVYTNSGAGNWATATGGTWNANTTCASAANQSTSVMTSAAFNTSTAGATVYLDFDYTFTLQTGASGAVAYWTGSAWTNVWTVNATGSGHVQVALPAKSTDTQLRFTGVMTKSGASNSAFRVDNIVVSSASLPYSWLTINSSTTGTVTPSGSNAINLTCNSAGLAEGTYNANITVASNDPDEPSKVLPVQFVVAQSTIIPGVPSNVVTSVVGTNIQIDWDASADATSYDVYVSSDPYGTFTFAANVPTNQYITTYADAKKFWYIVSKNATK
jgi:subtilisin family serine protease